MQPVFPALDASADPCALDSAGQHYDSLQLLLNCVKNCSYIVFTATCKLAKLKSRCIHTQPVRTTAAFQGWRRELGVARRKILARLASVDCPVFACFACLPLA